MDTSELQKIKQRYNIVGNSDGLNHALDVALQVAPTDLSVLIIGESGVGKEIIPRVIHDNSPRRREKYFAINCGSIPEGTIDSELFGHEKGSFTGAIGESEGYFGIANKGTIFLDEVGELPIQTQARLLRVLETGEYIRVGGTEIKKTDVRIVAATNVNMRKAVSEGRFREDLYYRLNTIPIQMPPLRDRGNDILLLFRLFAMQMAEKYRLPKITLSEDAKQIMLGYKWPGNVRQLKNLAENMSVTAEEREITPEVLSRYLPSESHSKQIVMVGEPAKDTHSFEAEREILYQILFDLRREVNELKRYVSEQRNGSDHAAADCVAKPNSLILEDQDHTVKFAEDGAQDLAYWAAEEVKDDEPAKPADGNVPAAETDTGKAKMPQSLDDLERDMIKRALDMSNGRRKVAADQLGISERTLYRKIKEYGLE